MWPLLFVSGSTTLNCGRVFRCWSVQSQGARANKLSSSQLVRFVLGVHQWGNFYQCTLVPGINHLSPAPFGLVGIHGPVFQYFLLQPGAFGKLNSGLQFCDFSLFLGPQDSSVSDNTLSFKMVPSLCISSQRERENGIALHCWMTQLLQEVLFWQNLPTDFKAVEVGGLSCG